MTWELKKVDVWSVVKISFFIYGVFGFIFGLFYLVFFAFMGSILSQLGGDFSSLNIGALGGLVGIFLAFLLAIFYAVIGAIFSAIFGWIYNILAKLIGGLKFNFSSESTSAEATRPSQIYE